MEVILNGQTVLVRRIVDIPGEKTVRVFLPEIGSVDLWEDEAYDEKGDWTYKDVENRLTEVFAAPRSLDEGGNAL